MTTDTLLTEAADALDNTANCRRCSGDGSIGEDDSERGPVWEDCPECARRNALARQLREREEKAEGLDAARYQWFRNRIRGERHPNGMPHFVLPTVKPLMGANIMQGSIAQHFDAAVDKDILATKPGEGENR